MLVVLLHCSCALSLVDTCVLLATLKSCAISSEFLAFWGGLLSISSIILQEPQPIDWEYYRKGIGSKVVDMYKEAYESK